MVLAIGMLGSGVNAYGCFLGICIDENEVPIYNCTAHTTQGGGGCGESGVPCQHEGMACGWIITYYTCDCECVGIMSGAGLGNCSSDSDCSGGGTTDNKWCYTCAGGCCCSS
jgi:hypothetical protein